MTDAVSASARALVVRVDYASCALVGDDGAPFEAIVRGSLMGARKSLGNAVVVGDVVELERERERHMISGVVPRRNSFSRRASGERPEEQVVAANLDQVVVVASVVDPEFKAGFVDRVLAQAEHAGIPARLVVNKRELAGADVVEGIADAYRRAGYATLAVSARLGDEVDHLRQVCRGRRSLFVGHSGVGKSTLLNALAPELELRAGAVNPKTGKGRHTTTAAWLLRVPPDIELIDTPGVRGFGLWGIDAGDLDQSYPEFRRWLGECKYADCRHETDAGCALRRAVEQGDIAMRRLESYLKLRDELAAEAEGERPTWTTSRRGRPRPRGGA